MMPFYETSQLKWEIKFELNDIKEKIKQQVDKELAKCRKGNFKHNECLCSRRRRSAERLQSINVS